MCRVARELPPPIKVNPNAGAFPVGGNTPPPVQPSSNMDVAVKVSNARVEIKSALVNRQCQVFELGPLVQEGKIGNTHLATILKPTNIPAEYERDNTAEPLSVKIYSLPDLKKSAQKFISNPWQEIDLYQVLDNYYTPTNKSINNPVDTQHGSHIVKLKEVCFVNQTIHMLFPHFKEGNLTSLLESKYANGVMPLEEVQKVVRNISSALSYLHEVGIVHNHVSFDNIYYSAKEDKYFLHDLSMAIRVPSNRNMFHATFGMSSPASLPCGQEGSLIAPEVWTATTASASVSDSNSVDNHKTFLDTFTPEMLFARDMWALGIIAYTLLTGSAPMERALETDAYYQVISQEERLVELYRQMLSSDEYSVVSDCNANSCCVEGIEAEDREDDYESAEEALLLEGLGLVQRMLLSAPEKRIVAKDVMIHRWILSKEEEKEIEGELMVMEETTNAAVQDIFCPMKKDHEKVVAAGNEGEGEEIIDNDPSLIRVVHSAQDHNKHARTANDCDYDGDSLSSSASSSSSSAASPASSSPLNVCKKRRLNECF